MRSLKAVVLIWFFLGFFPQLALAEEITIIYSGQTHAMLYPCSCPVRQDGGIKRRAALLKELRKKCPELLLLDCGNFTAGGQLDEHTQNIRLDMHRSEVNYRALELMQYDAVAVGPDEFNFGSEFFLKHARLAQPAYLSVNLDTDRVLPYIIKEYGRIRLAVIGLTGLNAQQKSEGLKVGWPAQLRQLVARLKKEGVQILVLLSTLGENQDLQLLSEIPEIDLIFIGDKPLKNEALSRIGATFILRPFWQGRRLGEVTLQIQNGRLSDCQLKEWTLSEEIGEDPDVAGILPACYADIHCRNKDLAGSCQNPGSLNATCLFTKPNKINLTVISAGDCRFCNTQAVLAGLKDKFPGLLVTNLDYADARARNRIQSLGIQSLPAFIFEKRVDQEENFEKLKNNLLLTKNFYLLKPQASGIAYFIKQKPKPGALDLFFSIFEQDAVLLLSRLKEFNPSLHFLVTEKNGKFEAKNGTGCHP